MPVFWGILVWSPYLLRNTFVSIDFVSKWSQNKHFQEFAFILPSNKEEKAGSVKWSFCIQAIVIITVMYIALLA